MKQDYSIIIEWENAKLSDLGRTRRMLTSLAEQIPSLTSHGWPAPDLLISYNPENIYPNIIHETLADNSGLRAAIKEAKIVPAKDMSYYELKNHGAQLAQSEFIIFLDSDVVPEPGWLMTLLTTILQPGKDAVAGNTYVEGKSIYAKAFALFWVFPLRGHGSAIKPSEHFFANNVAFRRSVFLHYGFPCRSTFRGQCTELARTLVGAGHGVYIHEAAIVDHPPPNGLRHFINRALCAGYDNSLYESPDQRLTSIRKAWERFTSDVTRACRRIRAMRHHVSLRKADILSAQSLALCYFSLVFVGECVSHYFPTLIPRHFAI